MDDPRDQIAWERPGGMETATIRASREDARPRMPEPPPVSLVSVQDVRLPVVAGLERELDAFYGDLLGFERVEGSADRGEGPVYRAENHQLCFFVVEVPPERQNCRPLGILTPHFAEIADRLGELKIEHELVRGLSAGEDGILLQDPTGNWIALTPISGFR
jgi:hypothetical protein